MQLVRCSSPVTHDGRLFLAAKHAKALRRYQYEIEQRRQDTALGCFDYLGVKTKGKYRWAPDRRLMMGFLVLRGSSPMETAGDYRETVYGGPPSAYVDPEKTSNGDGTLGNPWQFSQLVAGSASAGDIVGALPGVGTHTTTDDDGTPICYSGTAGSSGSPVVIVTQYNPLSMADPLTDGNRTGVGSNATTYLGGTNSNGDACPLIGLEQNYNIMDGFVLNDAEGLFVIDGGAVHYVGDNCALRRCYIKGQTRSGIAVSNYIGIWCEGAVNLEISDTTIRGMAWDTNISENTSGVTFYGCTGMTMENMLFFENQNAFFVKGSFPAETTYNSGTIRRCIIRNQRRGCRLQDIESAGRLDVYQMLFYDIGTDVSDYAIAICSATSDANTRNITLRNITSVISLGRNITTNDATVSGGGIRIHDNILYMPNNGAGSAEVIGFAGANVFERLRNNLYFYAGAATPRWAWNGTQEITLAGWQDHLTTGGMGATARDEDSALDDPDFTDLANDVYTLQVGSPALTMGTSEGIGGAGGEIGYNAGTPEMGPRA
jgi:hypothetical protein